MEIEIITRVDASAHYHVADEIFFNDDFIGVLASRCGFGAVPRRRVTEVRLLRRSSMQHPFLGILIGISLVGLPGQILFGDPLGVWWLLATSPLRLVGSFFMVCMGIYLLWCVCFSRKIEWITFVLDTESRAFPLSRPLSPRAFMALRDLYGPRFHADSRRDHPVFDSDVNCLKCQYNLFGTISGCCPECGWRVTPQMQEVIHQTRRYVDDQEPVHPS